MPRLATNRLSTTTMTDISLEERQMLMGSATKAGANQKKSTPKKNDSSSKKKAPKTKTSNFTAKDAELQNTADSEKASGRKSNGNQETFTVAEGENKVPLTNTVRNANPSLKKAESRNGLDPRVERGFTANPVVVKDKDDATFSGTLSVDKAKDTTVFQVLSGAPNGADKAVPVLKFDATVDTVKGSKGKNKGKDIKRLTLVDDVTGKQVYSGSPFGIEVDASIEDGKRLKVSLNGESVVNRDVDRDSSKAGAQPGERLTFRFGNYHHDRRDISKEERAENDRKGKKNKDGDYKVTKEAASTAEVTWADVRYSLTETV